MLDNVLETRVGSLSGEDDTAVPQLMGGTEEVKAAREQPLREARDVEYNAKRIKRVRQEDFVEQDGDNGSVSAPEANCVNAHEDGPSGESAVHHDSEHAEDIAVEERNDGDDESWAREGRSRVREANSKKKAKKCTLVHVGLKYVPEMLKKVKMTQYIIHVSGMQWKV